MLYLKWLLRKYVLTLCVLFFLAILILAYYNPEHSLPYIISNDYYDIEEALRHLPICNSRDRPNQRALLSTFHEWTKFARKHQIQYWISYGTLVGYVQRGGLLPHDGDIDLSIMAQATPYLFELSRLNFSSIYELVIHPQWYIIDDTKRSYFRSEKVEFVSLNGRFLNLKDNLHVDLWTAYDYHPNKTRVYKKDPPTITSFDNDYQWRSMPREWIFPLKECMFSGIKVWCPAQPEKLVSDIYGDISVNTSEVKCVNQTWVQSEEYKNAKKLMEMRMKHMTASTKETLVTTSTPRHQSSHSPIDLAVEQIPTCNSNDRPRHRTLLLLLQAWSRLADQHNLQYWLTFGSLIGYVQRRGLLPHDSDLHITMAVNDTQQLLNISRTNFSSNYQLKVHPQWNIMGAGNRSSFPDQGINFVTPNARFINLESKYSIDILPSYDANKQNLTVYDPDYNWMSHPKNWTYPLQTCYFSQIKMLCPADPKMLVETMFGVKALTKSDTQCRNGTWVEITPGKK
ncbi:unnamed protein product [Adineta ricciae]|uniref:LicD/FKTN/FKRP nucleotidyltransferase domain-containing protein n=1 Tax=Adineta ricciae TaxID=249248 RepID=A0A814AH57_ADIRI|nr:unnamed protein product [Adineta ricciae]CAF1638758.1 unnamed protein product [Adineta ricciae]